MAQVYITQDSFSIGNLVRHLLNNSTNVRTGIEAVVSSTPFNVVCGMELKNITKHQLLIHETWFERGLSSIPPISISPGSRDIMCMHKTGGCATGTSGVTSWKIGETGEMLVVMWSTPFNQNHYSNWLGIGIFPLADTRQYFNLMYYSEINDNFCRKDFYRDTNQLKYSGNKFCIDGVMGTSHKCEVQLIFYPIDIEDVAPCLINAELSSMSKNQKDSI